MAAKLELSHVFFVGILFFSCLVAPAEAYDTGDGLAWMLGGVLSVAGLCACLGWYSRSRDRHF